MLKKEFNRKDVERLRNLVKGKTGEGTETQVGYKKKEIKHQEGDVWEENGKKWTIKEGIKQTVTKLDKIKKEIFMPLCCPECGHVMKKRNDKTMWRFHKTCFDCVIKKEHKLRMEGKFENYEKNIIGKGMLTSIDDIEAELMEVVNTSNKGFVSEHGEVDKWVGGFDKDKIKKEIKDGVKTYKKNVKKQLK